MSDPSDHPFRAGALSDIPLYFCDTDSRLMIVRKLAIEQDLSGLQRILTDQCPGTPLQKSVRTRCEAAVRRLMKEGAADQGTVPAEQGAV